MWLAAAFPEGKSWEGEKTTNTGWVPAPNIKENARILKRKCSNIKSAEKLRNLHHKAKLFPVRRCAPQDHKETSPEVWILSRELGGTWVLEELHLFQAFISSQKTSCVAVIRFVMARWPGAVDAAETRCNVASNASDCSFISKLLTVAMYCQFTANWHQFVTVKQTIWRWIHSKPNNKWMTFNRKKPSFTELEINNISKLYKCYYWFINSSVSSFLSWSLCKVEWSSSFAEGSKKKG